MRDRRLVTNERPQEGKLQRLRILHILDHSLPMQSGYAFRTVSILREQRALGWETFHLTSPKQLDCSLPEETIDGWHFYRTALPDIRRRWPPGLRELALMRALSSRLEQLAHALQPDVLHAHSPALNAIPALRAGRRLGIPVVYEMRSSWEDAAVDQGTTTAWGLRYRLSRALETFALRRADAIVTICDGLRSDIVGRGISESTVTIVPNAVDIDDFPVGGAPDPTLAARLGLEGATVLGYIGSFFRWEGLDVLLAALPLMLPRRPEVRVLLVGGGHQEMALKALANELGIADKVVFAGRVPHGDIPKYYDLIDVCCYPRRSMRLTNLVTPLKPLEAMARGCLVASSSVGGHREMVDDDRTGILFRPDDPADLAEKVLRLLDDPNRWPDLRARARSFVERERNWPGSVARYRDVYDRIRHRFNATRAIASSGSRRPST
jgi:PEP-CTERM/exosortase A-associated glycosyltransferase